METVERSRERELESERDALERRLEIALNEIERHRASLADSSRKHDRKLWTRTSRLRR